MDAASEEPKDETVLESEKQEGLDGAKSEQLSDIPRPVAHTGAAENIPAKTRDQIVATLYGQCMGDAIGLLSEFYCRDEAIEVNFTRTQFYHMTTLLFSDLKRYVIKSCGYTYVYKMHTGAKSVTTLCFLLTINVIMSGFKR